MLLSNTRLAVKPSKFDHDEINIHYGYHTAQETEKLKLWHMRNNNQQKWKLWHVRNNNQQKWKLWHVRNNTQQKWKLWHIQNNNQLTEM